MPTDVRGSAGLETMSGGGKERRKKAGVCLALSHFNLMSIFTKMAFITQRDSELSPVKCFNAALLLSVQALMLLFHPGFLMFSKKKKMKSIKYAAEMCGGSGANALETPVIALNSIIIATFDAST